MPDDLLSGSEFMKLHGGPWRPQGDWMLAYCPAHRDGEKHGGHGGESLGVSKSRGVVECFAGCDFKAIMAAVREKSPQPVDFDLPVAAPRQPDKLVKEYIYVDEDGVVRGYKGRFEGPTGKRFVWRAPDSTTWPTGSSGLRMADMPLYGASGLKKTEGRPVYFVEGEKAADACADQGLVAVTGAGGASQKDFGKALEVLRGRTVHLWADNDAPGAAYMAYVRSQLQLLGCTVFHVQVALGPKEDAYDYFAKGGTVQGLESVDPSKPIVTITGEDSVQVRMATANGMVLLDFSEMDKSRRKFETKLTVSAFGHSDPYEERLNLDSNSGTTQLRRDLETVYGKEFEWTKLLNKAFGLAREAYLNQDVGMDVFDISQHSGEVFLVDPLVVANGPTIFFGDGGSLKSYITGMLALCFAFGQPFMKLRVPSLVPLVIDWEDEGSNYKRRLDRLAEGMGLGIAAGVHYFPGRGIPFADQVDAVKRYVVKHGVGVIIIDSVAPACGGDVMDVPSVIEFFRALKAIGLPSILIAHVTKQGDTSKPFGSAYWHNEARRTWYVSRESEEDSDEVDLALFCKKVNDGRMPHPLAYHATFSPDLFGPVTLSEARLDGMGEGIQQHRSDKDRVWAALGGQPRTAKELAQETGLSEATVDKLLRRGPYVVSGEHREGRGRPASLWARQENFRHFTDLAEIGEKVGENYPQPLFHD